MTALVRGVSFFARRRGRVNVVGVAIDIAEHRRGPAIEHRIRGRDPSEGGHNHLVARADPERREGQMQRGGAARGRQRVFDLMPLGKGRSKAATFGPCVSQPEV